MESIQVGLDVLREFERGLDPQHPETSRVPARVLGYGEISTVFAIDVEGLRGLAFKRLPIFHTQEEMAAYGVAHEEYNRLLREDVGLHLPACGQASFCTDSGQPVFYIIQRQLADASMGQRAIHLLAHDEILTLVHGVLRELRKVWAFNRRQNRLQVGLDGQISNWSIEGFDQRDPHASPDAVLQYVDTSTPLFRVQGVEQLNPELFLRSAPSFLAWALRVLFLADVVNRYYDFRRVVIDLVANFYKEQRADLVPVVIAAVNGFFAQAANDWSVQPITEQEVRSYYREDAFIWRFYLSARKVDRFLRTRLLRREYPYILPGKIQR
jgi:hypothetical protein